MTLVSEKYSTYHQPPNEALATIDAHREAVEERFELRPLETEFAFFMHRIGARGLYLADAADNLAGTFKWRGAMNKMANMKKRGERSGVAPSAGNALRGAALGGRILDMVVHGFVPTTAPSKKTDGAQQLSEGGPGFYLHVAGDTFDESLAYANRASHTLGEVIHPFDDPLVAAGQGTIADDIVAQAIQQGVDLRHVVVPVGGGGLMKGVAERFMEIDPSVTVHGVEAEGSDSLSRSHAADEIVDATQPNLRYGGSAVRRTGEYTLKAYQTLPNMRLWQASDAEVRALVDDYEDEIRYRELDKFPTFVPFEPTTLVAIAGLAHIAKEYPGENIAVVGTGRNDSLSTVWRNIQN